ncbi:MAG: hypothetical protein COB36_12490 [Alphaproteobacteria bacterium]|nr:MAG: hypothetical protein COB36_12490 [Alphaproteobacteria bacterium]
MHITSAHHAPTAAPVPKETIQAKAVNAADDINAKHDIRNRAPQETAPVKSIQSIENIMAKYNVASITPREIDALAEELQQSGHTDLKGLLMMTAQGESFQSHIARTAGTNHHFDPTKPVDLLSMAKGRLETARDSGETTKVQESYISFLTDLDVHYKASIISPASSTMSYEMIMGLTAE